MTTSKPVTSHVARRRLLKLAEFLEKLPRERFNYNVFADEGFSPRECGTQACALGWATTMPLFRRLGLRLTHDYVPIDADGNAYFKAGEGLFGLTSDEAARLFTPDTFEEAIATPKQVAAKIRKFVAKKWGA